MRVIIIILLGLISIYASCNKNMTVQFKLYLGDSLAVGNWSQVSGPSTLTFDKTVDSVVNISAASPKIGSYVIKAIKNGKTVTATINILK